MVFIASITIPHKGTGRRIIIVHCVIPHHLVTVQERKQIGHWILRIINTPIMPSLFRRIEAQVVDSFFCDKITKKPTVWIFPPCRFPSLLPYFLYRFILLQPGLRPFIYASSIALPISCLMYLFLKFTHSVAAYAFARASFRSFPFAVTPRTRPPFVTIPLSVSFVPAWKQ